MTHPEMYKILASCSIMHYVLKLFASIMQHHFSPYLEVIKTLCEAREHEQLVPFSLVGAVSEISL